MDYYRQYSLGTTVWHVWFCEVPLDDAPIEADVVENRLNQEVAAYFKWVSGGAASRMVELARPKPVDGRAQRTWRYGGNAS